MHRIIRIKSYEAEHGPHFNDEHARKAVSKMENEDGTRGQHWSLEETTALANQYGIRLDEWLWMLRKEVIMFFNFNPYTFNRSRVRTIDNFGIPSLRTIYVTTDTTNNTVTYGICPRIWRQLPCEGMFLLNIVNTPATTVTAASLVSIDTTRTANQVSPTTTTSTGARALINGSGDQMVTEEISTGNRYLIYYNKSNGTFQTVNHIIPPTTAAA